ncbi:MAG: hypothetical protein IPG51_04085 [Chloroflexi bacterium]|nr:hypothetical protein [Chloroflexota bacterium]
MYQNGRFARITLTIFLIVRDCQHKLIEDPFHTVMAGCILFSGEDEFATHPHQINSRLLTENLWVLTWFLLGLVLVVNERNGLQT